MEESDSPKDKSSYFSADDETPARKAPESASGINFAEPSRQPISPTQPPSRKHSRLWNKRLSEISNPNDEHGNADYWEIEEAIRLLQDALPRLSGVGISPVVPQDDDYTTSENNFNRHHYNQGNRTRQSRTTLPYGEYKVSGRRSYGTIPDGGISHPIYPSLHTGANMEETLPLISEENSSFKCTTYTKVQIMTLVSMLLLEVAAFAAMSILAPFFPAVVSERGLSKTINGVIFSTYGFVVVVSSPLMGMLVPFITPRSMYLLGIFLSAISNWSMGFVPLINDDYLFIAVCIMLRGLAALGSTCFFIVIYGIVPILYPIDVNSITGMLETAVGIGMCIGPAIGEWLYGIGGYSLPFFTLGGFIFLILPISFLLFPNAVLPPVTERIRPAEIIFQKDVLRPASILVVTAACVSGLYPTLQPHMSKIGVNRVGLVFLLMSAVYSLSSPLVGLAIDRWNCDSWMTSLGLVFTTISLVLLGSSPILPEESHEVLYQQDVLSIVLLGLASSMCIVPTYAQMLGAANRGRSSSNLAISSFIGGFWSSSYSAGEMIGPLCAAVMSEFLSFASTTSVTALLPLSLICLFTLEWLFGICGRCYYKNNPKSIETPVKYPR